MEKTFHTYSLKWWFLYHRFRVIYHGKNTSKTPKKYKQKVWGFWEFFFISPRWEPLVRENMFLASLKKYRKDGPRADRYKYT